MTTITIRPLRFAFAFVAGSIVWLGGMSAISAQDAAAEGTASPKDAKTAASDVAEREKQFEASMRNVTLVGYFTASDQPAGKLSEERYIIDKVVKQDGDTWVFHARIQYGKNDVPVRLPIPVKWAGDTPVISVTKLAVPLLGTFNARVLIYDGQYAGTWEGAGHGGQLFGRIEKNKDAVPKAGEPGGKAAEKRD